MSRGLTPAQATAARGPHRQILPLIELYFTSGTLLLTLGPWDYTSLSGTYIHTGPLAYVKPLSESSASQQGLEIGMTGLDPSIMQLAATENYRGKLGRILKGFIAVDSNEPIGEPVPAFIGRMKSMTITEDNTTASVAIQLEHYEVQLSKPAPLRYNDADQQRLFPGDKGCQYAAETANKTVIWPSKAAQGG